MPVRVLCAALGVVFGVILAVLGFGAAALVLVTTIVGYSIGAAIEGSVDLSALLSPLRRRR